MPSSGFGVSDQQDEAEVQHHHRRGQADRNAPAGGVERLQLFCGIMWTASVKARRLPKRCREARSISGGRRSER